MGAVQVLPWQVEAFAVVAVRTYVTLPSDPGNWPPNREVGPCARST